MKRGTREKKEHHGRRRADQTRSLFASPIIRFWALHYDFSIRLIDWSSKLVKIKSVPDKSIVVSRRHLVEGEKSCRQFWSLNQASIKHLSRDLCNDKANDSQIYSSPTQESSPKTIEKNLRLHWTFHDYHKSWVILFVAVHKWSFVTF